MLRGCAHAGLCHRASGWAVRLDGVREVGDWHLEAVHREDWDVPRDVLEIERR